LWVERLDAPSSQRTNSTHQNRSVYFSPIHVQLFGEAMLRYHAVVHKLPSVVTRIGWLVSEDDPTSVGEVERAFMRGLYVTSTFHLHDNQKVAIFPPHAPDTHAHTQTPHTQLTHTHTASPLLRVRRASCPTTQCSKVGEACCLIFCVWETGQVPLAPRCAPHLQRRSDQAPGPSLPSPACVRSQAAQCLCAWVSLLM
jgi:hypothetical protein